MIIKIIPILLLTCSFSTAFAQNNKLVGTVRDSDHKPACDCVVKVFKGRNYIAGSITDSLGNYEMKHVAEGKCYMTFTCGKYSVVVEDIVIGHSSPNYTFHVDRVIDPLGDRKFQKTHYKTY